ncbi:MAG: tyrosine-type recombinase/integrase, partial [Acidobacteriota bacterium]|nr:tyrosine-type recombinase/integrase [Acidobacteriota bacterium]
HVQVRLRGYPPQTASFERKTDARKWVQETESALRNRHAPNSGVEDFRFHDLRHSAASHLAMNGANSGEIAEVLGHRTLQMVKRYSHLSPAHTASMVARMDEAIFQSR